MTRAELVRQAVDRFDCEAAAKVFALLRYTWRGSKVSPTADEIRKALLSLSDSVERGSISAQSGRLVVYAETDDNGDVSAGCYLEALPQYAYASQYELEHG